MDHPNKRWSRAGTSARAGAAVFVAMLAGCAAGADDEGAEAQALTRAGLMPGARATVAAGVDHTCAIAADGAVWCWGQNAFGQLGTNTVAPSTSPVRAGALAGAVAVSVGLRHSCALLGGGAVWCWGDNAAGQLGDGTTTPRRVPTRVASVTGATALVAGQRHTCALLGDGTVRCWGDNASGAVGTGVAGGSVPSPAAVTGFATGPRALALAAGAAHTCALLSFGHVRCWGANHAGQLGTGSTTPSASPVAVAGSFAARAIAAGDDHTCAALVDGTVRCWGANADGQLGTGSTSPTLSVVQPSGVTGVVDVAAGARHTCARDARSVVRCWGDNRRGQLGDGAVGGIALTPTFVSGYFHALDGGATHSCAVGVDGTLQCTGAGELGQLGRGTTVSSATFAPVVGISVARRAVDVAAGGGFTCARRSGGPLYCWGRNDRAQYGHEPSVGGTTPRAHSLTGIGGVTAGGAFGCGVYFDYLFCWGDNQQSQVAQPALYPYVEYPADLLLRRVTSVAAGAQHACALDAAGVVRCWGRNAYAQLGRGFTSLPSTRLDPVPDLDGVVAVAAGGEHTCALHGTGFAWCWGANSDYQTGQRSSASAVLRPAMVASLGGLTAITAGARHTCALGADGAVWCWGANDAGQLGDAQDLDRATAHRVEGLPSAVAIDAGAKHTCAISADGAVWCWGANEGRRFDDSDTMVHRRAVQVASLRDMVAVSAGDTHTCGVRADETVWCWGSNSYGELGVAGDGGAIPLQVTALP